MATKCSSSVKKHDCPKPKRYSGFTRDTPDHRDLIREYGSREIPSTDDDPMIDLRKYVHKVHDQGRLASCTANIICAAYSLVLNVEAEEASLPFFTFDPSRLFVYYNSRGFNNEIAIDAGAPLRDALKSIHHFGVCEETQWPYDVQTFALKPPFACYVEAAGNTIYQYVHIGQSIDQFRACLKEGFPFAFGTEVYGSFEDDEFGYIPVPSDDEIQSTPDPLMHAVLAVGYDDRTERITVMNSWGESFGDNGYLYMPYSYICDPRRAFDFWKIERVNKSI